MFLEVLCGCLCIEVAVTSSSFHYLPLGERCLLSVLVDVLRIFQTFYGYNLLHAFCFILWVLKLVCYLWTPQCPWLSADSLSSVFSDMVLEPKFVVSLMSHRFVLLCSLSSHFPKTALTAAIRNMHKNPAKVCRYMWVRHMECWGCSWINWGDPWVRCSQ